MREATRVPRVPRVTPITSVQLPSAHDGAATWRALDHAAAWLARWPFVPLAALLVIGAALRFAAITRQSLWLDEAFSVYLAAHPFSDQLAFIAGSDAHPPLYYLMLHVWMLGGSSPLALRLLSALASIAALAPMYALGRRLAGEWVAVIATALLAGSAFQVWYAQEARMYALTTLAVLLALAALARAMERTAARAAAQGGGQGAWVAWGSWAGFVAAMLAALYLDYSALYVYTAVLWWFGLFGWRRVALRRPFALSLLAIGLGYLPWLPALWRQLFVVGGLTAWIGGASGTGLMGVFRDLFLNRTNLSAPDAGLGALVIGLVCLVLVGLALWLPRGEPAYPLLAIWLIWPCALGLVAGILAHPILIARNVLVIQPPLFLLLALAAERGWRTLPARETRVARRAVVIAGLALFFGANLAAQATAWQTTVKEDWRGVARLVAGQQQSGDLALFDAYFAQMPFDYAYHRIAPAGAALAERGYLAQESLLYADAAQTGGGVRRVGDITGYARVWLILSHTGAPSDAAAVPTWLFAGYGQVREWRLVGVTVQLYEMRPPGGPPAPG